MSRRAQARRLTSPNALKAIFRPARRARLIALHEPSAHHLHRGSPAPHDDATLVLSTWPVFPEIQHGPPQRGLHDGDVADRPYAQPEDRQDVAPEQGGDLILDHHQVMILKGVILPDPRDAPAIISPLPAPQVIGGRCGVVKGAPSKQLGPPTDIHVLLIGEEIFVEVFLVDLHFLEHRLAKEHRRPADAEDLLRPVILTLVHLSMSPVNDPPIPENEVTGAVQDAGPLAVLSILK